MPNMCKKEGCKKYAGYVKPGTTQRIACKDHSEGMVPYTKIDRRICKECDRLGVSKRASYNFEDEKRPIYCYGHKDEGMINLNNKNNKCVVCKNVTPIYGLRYIYSILFDRIYTLLFI
jgi:hypothetical protein